MNLADLPPDIRARHCYIVGATGVGKSNLLEGMMLHDIEAGHGVGFIDPHGSSASKIARQIPKWRMRDLVYLNSEDKDRPVQYNPLSDISKGHSVATDDMVSVFVHLFGEDAIGPRTQQVLRNSIRALLDVEDASLLHIPKLLTDKIYRISVLENTTDPFVRSYWQGQFEKYDDRKRDEVVGPILNKLDAFLSSPDVRNIISFKSTFTFKEVMDGEKGWEEDNHGNIVIENGKPVPKWGRPKIFVANLDKAQLGEQNSHILGAFLVSSIAQAAFSRERPDKPFYLYVDEFQNFASGGFATILSEARKKGLCLTIANQGLGQLPVPIRDSVFSNVGTMAVFRVGALDAPILAAQLGWKNPDELTDRQQYHMRVRVFPGDSLDVSTDAPPCVSMSDVAVQNSRNRYGRDREKVERKIRLFLDSRPSIPDVSMHGTVLRKIRAGSRAGTRQSRT